MKTTSTIVLFFLLAVSLHAQVIIGSATACSNEANSVYSTVNIVGHSYNWSVSGGAITAGAGTNSITVTWGASGAGTVDVTETVTATGISTVATQKSVTIHTLTAPGVITGTAQQCANQIGEVYSVPAAPNASSYTWCVPTGWVISSGQGTTSITVITGAAGQNGNITVSAGNDCGFSAVTTLAIAVSTPPNAPVIASLTQPSCSVATATVILNSLPAGVWTLTRTPGNVVTTGVGTSTMIAGLVAGTYTYTVTGSSGCTSLPTENIVINPQPPLPATPTVIKGGAVQSASVSELYTVDKVTNATSYTWSVPTGWSITAGQGTDSVTVTTGAFGRDGNVTVTANNVCGSSAECVLSVSIKKSQYFLTMKTGDSGSLNLAVASGTSPTVGIVPTDGWMINTVTYNGVDVTPFLVNNTYTIPTLVADAAISVVFVSNTLTNTPQHINRKVKVYSIHNEIVVEGAIEGETVTLYGSGGTILMTTLFHGEKIFFPIDQSGVYLLTTMGQTFKVII